MPWLGDVLVPRSVYVFCIKHEPICTQIAWFWQTHAVKLAVDRLEDSHNGVALSMPFGGGSFLNLESHVRRKCYPNSKSERSELNPSNFDTGKLRWNPKWWYCWFRWNCPFQSWVIFWGSSRSFSGFVRLGCFNSSTVHLGKGLDPCLSELPKRDRGAQIDVTSISGVNNDNHLRCWWCWSGNRGRKSICGSLETKQNRWRATKA